MSIFIVFAIFIAGLMLFYSPVTNPIFWRKRVAKRVLNDTITQYRHGVNIQNAHTNAVNLWHDYFLQAGTETTRELFAKMMDYEFPRQIKMLNLKIYGENYKSEYANIKNKEELLSVIESERANYGEISNFEKVFIDKAALVFSSIANEKQLLEAVPHILLGLEIEGFPTTFEEVRDYLRGSLKIKLTTSAV